MKNIKLFLFTFAVFGLFDSVAYADDVNTLKTKIESYVPGGTGTGSLSASVSGDTVTVTGTVNNATNTLFLNINANVTVLWKATFTGFVNGFINLGESGMGTFEVSSGNISSSGMAIANYSTGKIIISGTAKVTSSIYDSRYGAIFLSNSDTSTACRLEISGGTVENMIGLAISNDSPGEVEISGGTISARNAPSVLNNSTGTINISGGAISSSNGAGVFNMSTGTVNISGGSISTTLLAAVRNQSTGTVHITGGDISTNSAFNCIENTSAGTVNISAGTVSTTTGIAIFNDSVGTINISGDTTKVQAIGANGRAIYNKSSGKVNITNGLVSSANNMAITNARNGLISISGGTVTSAIKDYLLYGTIYLSNEGTSTDCRLEITGGTVENTSTTGNAIRNYSVDPVNISGGRILAKEGYAVNNASTGHLTVSGGVCFAYGTAVTHIVNGPLTTPPENKALFVAWNKAAGKTEYKTGLSDDIFVSPATVSTIWAKQDGCDGILSTLGDFSSFVPVEEVTLIGDTGTEKVINNPFRVFPNPTTGKITLSGELLSNSVVVIYDMMGKMVFTAAASPIMEIDISHLPSGVYIVKAGACVRKIIKE